MGIDIYMRWKDQNDGAKAAQFTGFSVVSGDVGYLREAYHGGPYATRVLLPESFEETDPPDEEGNGVPIPAAKLRERLPAAIAALKERYANVYKETLTDDAEVIASFRAFVELAERVEKETGEPVRVYASW